MTPEVATRPKTRSADAEVLSLRPLRPVEHSQPLPLREVGPLESQERFSEPLLWREALHRRLLGAADVVGAAAAVAIALAISGQRDVLVTALAAGALVLLLFKVTGLYDRDDLRLVHSTLDEVPLLLQLTGLLALGLAVVRTSVLGNHFGGDLMVALWVLPFAAILGGRMVARAVAGHSAPTERCLVIGDTARVERIRGKLLSSRARAAVVASLPLAEEELQASDWPEIPTLIRWIVEEHSIHRIIIAPTTTDTNDVVELIRVAKAVGVRVSVLPRMFEVVGSAVEFDDVDGMTMLGVRRFGLSRSSWRLKRVFDACFAAVVCAVLGPLMLAIAAVIKIESPGPVLFRQTRVGRDGRHFEMFKFRSMIQGAEAAKESLRSLNEAGAGLFKLAADPRVTRVGRVLRRTSMDELPQLINVLRGEMSLVGPRPLVVDEDAQVLGLDRSRLHLTPGMTGPWQVLGLRVPMQEMVGIDYLYVANWSLWLDLKILLRTARHIARRGNV